MAELKTKPNEQSVEAFLNGVEDEKKRQDCFTVLEIMKQITKAEPQMWGPVSLALALTIINMKVAAKATGSWPDFLRASKT